ncbi:MAG: right-handed parallel beta-helix repeat-containing protein, partial [Frankia sp.]
MTHRYISAITDRSSTKRRRGSAVFAGVSFLTVATTVAAFAVAFFAVSPSPAARAEAPPIAPAVSVADAKKQRNMVDVEDIRLRSTFARFGVIHRPTLVTTQGSLPTLLLPARAQAYTVRDLIAAGAMQGEVDGSYLLTKNVIVGPDANLVIQGGGTLRMASGAGGFATLSSWRGGLQLSGTATSPLKIIGWNPQNLVPDKVVTDGRAYLRTLGGQLLLRNVQASYLGFWSGRTGGVAWTGSKGEPASGGSASSTFTNNAYGLFVSGSNGVQIVGARVEGSEYAGVAVHRDAVATNVSTTTAIHNLGDGFAVDRASQTRLLHDVSTENAKDGFVLDGRGTGLTTTAAGTSASQAQGTVMDGDTATGNRGYGIRVLGGQDIVVRNSTVTCLGLGVVVKSGAINVHVVNVTVNGAKDAGLQAGPDAKNTALNANTVNGAAVGILTENATGSIITTNRITGATKVGITLRGPANGSKVQGNSVQGVGWRPIDIRKAIGMVPADVSGNSTGGWTYRVSKPWYSLLEQHPALLIWLFIIVMLCFGWQSGRRSKSRPLVHPYPETDLLVSRGAFGSEQPAPAPSPALVGAGVGAGAGARPARVMMATASDGLPPRAPRPPRSAPADRPAAPPPGGSRSGAPRGGAPRPTGPRPPAQRPPGHRPPPP